MPFVVVSSQDLLGDGRGNACSRKEKVAIVGIREGSSTGSLAVDWGMVLNVSIRGSQGERRIYFPTTNTADLFGPRHVLEEILLRGKNASIG